MIRWSVFILSVSLLLAGVGGCQTQDPELEGSPQTEQRFLEDGTDFHTSLGTLDAVTDSFPRYLIYRDGVIHSSGRIQDEEGGIVSLLLTTSDSSEAVIQHYRDQLWTRPWELLSESVQAGVTTLIFEYDGQDSERALEQIVIQVGNARTETSSRDILVLWSWLEDPEVEADGLNLAQTRFPYVEELEPGSDMGSSPSPAD